MIKFQMHKVKDKIMLTAVSMPFWLKALHFAAMAFLISLTILVWICITMVCFR